eukprot:4969940-Amphidinium_carterae.1
MAFTLVDYSLPSEVVLYRTDFAHACPADSVSWQIEQGSPSTSGQEGPRCCRPPCAGHVLNTPNAFASFRLPLNSTEQQEHGLSSSEVLDAATRSCKPKGVALVESGGRVEPRHRLSRPVCKQALPVAQHLLCSFFVLWCMPAASMTCIKTTDSFVQRVPCAIGE